MAFVRKKLIRGNEYYYLVEYRDGMQKHLKYLGKKLSRKYKSLWKQGKKGRRLT